MLQIFVLSGPIAGEIGTRLSPPSAFAIGGHKVQSGGAPFIFRGSPAATVRSGYLKPSPADIGHIDAVTAAHLSSIKQEVNKQDRRLQKLRVGGRDLDLQDAW